MYRLLLILPIVFIGCFSNKEVCKEPKVITKVEVVEKIVPIKCKVPEVHCEFGGDDFEPTKKLLECIVEQKRALEVCRDNIATDPRNEEKK